MPRSAAGRLRGRALRAAAHGTVCFTAIPAGFEEKPNSEFDRDCMRRLFAVGREAGAAGQWQAKAPRVPVASR